MSRFLWEKYRAMLPYVPGEQPRAKKLIKLNTNESPYPPCPGARAALNDAEAASLRLYSDPEAAELVGALADFYGLQKENVMVGNGSDEVLAFSFLAFGGKGALFPDISYGFYPVWAELFGVEAREIPLRADFSVNPADYAADAGLMLLANPNAPTGLSLGRGEIEKLLQNYPNRLLLVDEAYVDFGGESCAPLVPRYDNLLVVQTFSKSRSLAGARIGFALGNVELIQDLNKIKFSFNPYNLNRLSIRLGTEALRDRVYFEDCRKKIIAERERTRAALLAMGFAVTASKTNFLFARHPSLSGAACQALLRENGILVRRFDKERIRDYLRISIGTRDEMDALLQVLKASVETEKGE